MTVLQELDQFNRFAQVRLRGEESGLSLEACLKLWRQQCEEEETIASIQRGIADYEAGRTTPLNEAVEEVRRELEASR